MRICFAASEVTPFSKTGGLADVAGALPRELAALGHDVRLFTPLYSAVDRKAAGLRPEKAVQDVDVQLGTAPYRFSLLRGSSGDARLYFVDCPALYHRGEIYTSDGDEPQRFALLCRAVFESCQRMGWSPEILHCHDWHTALVPLLRKTIYDWDHTLFGKTRTILTIHNLGYQGVFGEGAIADIGLDGSRRLFDHDDLTHGRVNFLRTGLLYADLVTTVSPTYAREIQTDGYGMGLAPLLRARGDSLIGILNGVDYGEWDPAADPLIPHPFTREDREGKRRTRQELLRQLGLDRVGDRPLVGIISRLVVQKGFDLTFPVLPELVGRGAMGLVALGQGESRYEEFFSALERSYPGRVVFHRGHNTRLAHLIEAASDMFLMPSRYEPCGLNQLFSLRYGTIPIVRRTGGLADSVIPYDPKTGEGTGFVFEHFSPDGLRWAMEQAIGTFHDRPRWDRLVGNAMSADFSWPTQAERYARVYAALAAGR